MSNIPRRADHRDATASWVEEKSRGTAGPLTRDLAQAANSEHPMSGIG